jgi:hypothetical protein
MNNLKKKLDDYYIEEENFNYMDYLKQLAINGQTKEFKIIMKQIQSIQLFMIVQQFRGMFTDFYISTIENYLVECLNSFDLISQNKDKEV